MSTCEKIFYSITRLLPNQCINWYFMAWLFKLTFKSSNIFPFSMLFIVRYLPIFHIWSWCWAVHCVLLVTPLVTAGSVTICDQYLCFIHALWLLPVFSLYKLCSMLGKLKRLTVCWWRLATLLDSSQREIGI